MCNISYLLYSTQSHCTWFFSSRDMLAHMLASFFLRMVKSELQWKCSSTLRSLYNIASGLSEFTY